MRHPIILSSILFSMISFAQDVNFNQVNLTNLYSNPAITGVNGEKKISAAFRNQWPTFSGTIRSTYVSYQDGASQFGNFGAYYMNSYYSNGAFNSNRLGLNYAKPIKVTKNLTVTPGISGSLIFDHINFSKVTFGDMANPRTGKMYDPLELKENTFSADFSGGILLTWKNIFGSISLNQFGSIGAQSIFNTYSNFGISLSAKEYEFTLIPEISLNTMQGFYNTAMKVSSYYKWAKLGVEYNLRNSFSVIAGARIGLFDFAISTEWSVLKLTNTSGLSFEAGLSYKLPDQASKNNETWYNYSLF